MAMFHTVAILLVQRHLLGNSVIRTEDSLHTCSAESVTAFTYTYTVFRGSLG